MTRDEEEREQAEFNRKADRTARWIGPEGCIAGCLPAIVLLVLPPLALVL